MALILIAIDAKQTNKITPSVQLDASDRFSVEKTSGIVGRVIGVKFIEL